MKICATIATCFLLNTIQASPLRESPVAGEQTRSPLCELAEHNPLLPAIVYAVCRGAPFFTVNDLHRAKRRAVTPVYRPSAVAIQNARVNGAVGSVAGAVGQSPVTGGQTRNPLCGLSNPLLPAIVHAACQGIGRAPFLTVNDLHRARRRAVTPVYRPSAVAIQNARVNGAVGSVAGAVGQGAVVLGDLAGKAIVKAIKGDAPPKAPAPWPNTCKDRLRRRLHNAYSLTMLWAFSSAPLDIEDMVNVLGNHRDYCYCPPDSVEVTTDMAEYYDRRCPPGQEGCIFKGTGMLCMKVYWNEEQISNPDPSEPSQ